LKIVKFLTNIILILFLFVFINCSNNTLDKDTNDNNTNADKPELIKDTADYIPKYVELSNSGELKRRAELLWNRMYCCDLCPRNCKVDRISGERGVCGANSEVEIAMYGAHFGEEPAFVGEGGTGRIFFTNCPLKCVYCINAKVSQEGYGEKYSIEELAEIMLSLQSDGCENICLVTPTHYTPQILFALDIAVKNGLCLPIIYNTSAYENQEVLKQLDGVVDIYLTDIKFGCSQEAGKYTVGAYNYVDSAYNSLMEMQAQVGIATKDSISGLWKKGLIIRHLVMPNNVSCSKDILKWISENLPKDTYITIMPNYEPLYKASQYPSINCRVEDKEYEEILNAAKGFGLKNIH
jgi:putative pyruvate formate lyase activating enzyme